MQTLEAQATATGWTGAFETIGNGKVWIHVVTTTGAGGVVTLQHSIGRSTTYTDFYPDGALETFTVDESTKLFDLPGGVFWRLENDATATATTAYVAGNVRVNVQDAGTP